MSTERIELDQTVTAWYQAILAADAEIERLKAIRERAAEQVQAAMGDAVEATIGGRPIITWKPAKPSMRLDRFKLEETYGVDEIALFLVPAKAARPFGVLPADGA